MKPLVAILLALALVRHAFANPAHDQLMKMTPSERNAAMTRFMKDGGDDCMVVETFFQGGKGGDVFWNVRCSNTKAYSVKVKDDARGSASILDCGVLKAVTKGTVECFKKLPKE